MAPGANLVLRVIASGQPPVWYQWRLNGVNIPGAISPTLIITNAQPTNGGSYQVFVANFGGAVISEIATLVVSSPALPFSDNFNARGMLTSASGVGSGSNVSATRQVDEPNHVGIRGGRSVWLGCIKGVCQFGGLVPCLAVRLPPPVS